jgi:negative regulator of flagellin synthesis FlgM
MVIRFDNKSADVRQARSPVTEAARSADAKPASSLDAQSVKRAPAESAATVSELGARLKLIEGKLSASEPFSSKRVAEIKAEIREGRYKINPEKVADAILESAVLLSSHKGF